MSTSKKSVQYRTDECHAGVLGKENHMRRTITAAVIAIAAIGAASPVFADAPPPTEGGNGAGSSGQCTGPQDDRPASCHSQGGPGDQP